MNATVMIDESKMKKKQMRFWVFFGFFVTMFVAAIIGGIVLDHYTQENDYAKLQAAIQSDDVAAMDALYKQDYLLDYEDAVANYEKVYLGNSNANILQDGKVCTRDNYVLDATGGNLVKIEGETEQTIVKSPVSFVNERNGTIYYRLEKDKSLMAFADGQHTVVLKDTCVGQCLIDGDVLYYINLDNNAYIHAFDFTTSEDKVIVEKPMQYFAIVGNRLITVSRANDFVIYNKQTGFYKTGLSNATSFVLNADGKLYVSDGKNIISCSVNLRNEERVAMAEGQLIAVLGNAFLVQNDTSLVYVFDDASYLVAENIGTCKYASIQDGALTMIIKPSTKDEHDDKGISKKISDIVLEDNLLE